ncbi:C-terminal binding protein [Cytobacillus depressus]|uniref:C-terminal binding protein n=1 Tax=Cytobacillus depressus TaxID=1602942 RepID=A0A6L3UYS7_9BACI|nr:C-terminal binding protein [Cytobacillus depressus]KAB2329555.1 C-terminal binding protein [Cytobacillus depressus]
MSLFTIGITDCDHPSVEIEQNIINKSSGRMVLHQCKTEEDVIRECSEADGLLNQYAPLTRNVLSQLPRCKVIVRYGVGINNIDLDAASDYGIQVCNVPDYGVDEVSDHALALLYTLARKTLLLGNSVRKGEWEFSISRPILRLRDQVVGVVGLGRIGSAFAKKAHGAGFKVIGYDQGRNRSESLPFVERVSFEQLLELSDIISVHCPLTNETKNLFGEKELLSMKSSAFIINTARGSIINEVALNQALEKGWIAGAALDVMEVEPPNPNNPLLQRENCIITPHVAWYSEQAFDELKRKAAEEAVRFLKRQEIYYPMNLV